MQLQWVKNKPGIFRQRKILKIFRPIHSSMFWDNANVSEQTECPVPKANLLLTQIDKQF